MPYSRTDCTGKASTAIKEAYRVSRDLAAAIGAIGIASFYTNERSLLWLGPATLALAGAWYVLWRLRKGFAAEAAPRKQPGARVPAMSSRFIYFDSETGEEVRKMEPVQ